MAVPFVGTLKLLGHQFSRKNREKKGKEKKDLKKNETKERGKRTMTQRKKSSNL